MKIREKLERWIFNRDLRLARKRFERVRKSSVYNREPDRMVRRNYIKDILRLGFKSIRIKER